MCGRYYPSKDTNICDPWRTQIFLQAIFGGVSPERCQHHPPPLAKWVQTASVWFPPSQMCPLFAWLWEHLLHELRVCDSFEKVSVLESQETSKSKILLEMFIYDIKTSLSDVTQRTSGWQCFVSLMETFLSQPFGPTRYVLCFSFSCFSPFFLFPSLLVFAPNFSLSFPIRCWRNTRSVTRRKSSQISWG